MNQNKRWLNSYTCINLLPCWSTVYVPCIKKIPMHHVYSQTQLNFFYYTFLLLQITMLTTIINYRLAFFFFFLIIKNFPSNTFNIHFNFKERNFLFLTTMTQQYSAKDKSSPLIYTHVTCGNDPLKMKPLICL